MAKKFKDDNFKVVKVDVEKMRTRPSMYIGGIGYPGAQHLIEEIVNNSIDECLKKDSPADTVMVDIFNNGVRVRDNGRGIPIDLLKIIHETNQAGSNFTRETGTMSAGENGTGTTCAVAMSSNFKVTTYRPFDKKKLTLIYKEGKLKDEILEDYTGDHHGLETEMSPSEEILGVKDIDCDRVIEWLEAFKFVLPKSINMSYTYKGETTTIKHEPFENVLMNEIDDENIMAGPYTIQCDGTLVETYRLQKMNKSFRLEACISYAQKQGKDIRKAWMNMLYNSGGGAHIDGVINGYAKFIAERAIRKKPSLKEEKNLRKDIEMGLQVAVNANCNMINMFQEQSKAYVFPVELKKAIAESVYNALEKESPSVINELVDIVIANNRVRREGERVRDISSTTKREKWERPDSYIPCATKTKEKKEIFLVEGQSAGGGLRSARMPYQAILEFRGVLLNVFGMSISEALKSMPIKNLAKILECGVGETFDIKRLAFDKIIICTDADIDGYHIRTQMCTLFLLFWPEIIKAGKLYIAEPPLYKLIKDKKVSYVASQTEYVGECIKSVGKMDVRFPQSKNHKNDRCDDFIIDAFKYLDRLTEASINRSVDRNLLEHIAYAFVKYGRSVEAFRNNVDAWLKTIVKIYPETRFNHDRNEVYSTIDFRDHLVVIDDELIYDLSYVIDVLDKYGLIIEYNSESRSGSSSLGTFFGIISAVYPRIEDRYKGLGSSSAKVSREVIMDPKTRRIFRVTAEDINVMKKMSKLVGKGKEDLSARKEMISNYEWNEEIIDN